jgi:alpha-beta hydrolase superfamily lysophospholipase
MCNPLLPHQQEADITTIDFTADGFRLVGTLYQPPAPTDRIVIGCHGLLSDRSSPKQAALAHECNNCQIAYLAFDHRGCGQSEGDFTKVTTLPGRCRDLLAANDFVRSETDYGEHVSLFGSSMGGTVCLTSAGKIKPVAVVVIAAPINSQIIGNPDNTEDTGDFPPSFYEKNLQFDISAKISSVSNLLVFHGDADKTVPLSHGRDIHARSTAPKKLIVQRGGDHRMSASIHQEQFMTETVKWFARF